MEFVEHVPAPTPAVGITAASEALSDLPIPVIIRLGPTSSVLTPPVPTFLTRLGHGTSASLTPRHHLSRRTWTDRAASVRSTRMAMVMNCASSRGRCWFAVILASRAASRLARLPGQGLAVCSQAPEAPPLHTRTPWLKVW
jgi:hypothetical protein